MAWRRGLRQQRLYVPSTSFSSIQADHVLQGLQRGDKITRFGSVNAGNHDGLKAVAGEVSKNENVGIKNRDTILYRG